MNEKNYNILIVGVGGQGIILASDILTAAALFSGLDAKKSEIHGMSQRGGSVFSHIRFGKKIHSPVISRGEADILLSLEQMETLRWINYAGEKTLVVCTTTRIKPPNVEEYPGDIDGELKKCRPFIIDTDKTAEAIGNKKFVNVALLGFVSARIGFNDDSWKKAIQENVPSGSFDDNWNAFLYGKKSFKEVHQ
ncbi:MAG: indolepyruvate oxidoreductase subunit beta [Spirochaetales bacterium]|nr:indolepyruvate oxidoreductase subunit beta [Spirochaetales bacterium]